MKKFKSMNEILDFAINSEQEAANFYTSLAAKARNKEMKEVFEQFANEEMGHKAKLMRIKEEGSFELRSEKIIELKIADYIADVEAKPNMGYQDALVVAMKREEAAYKLYTSLANNTNNAQLKNIFLALAQEESKHKHRFEAEYDDFIYTEN